MKVKAFCEFEIEVDLYNNEGDIETDTEKYKEYISFLLSKSHSKALNDFFADVNKNDSDKNLLESFLSKRLAKQVDETKDMMDSLKLEVELKD
jgi:hypothetical protein